MLSNTQNNWIREMGKGLGVCLVGLIWFGALGFSFPSWGVGEGAGKGWKILFRTA